MRSGTRRIIARAIAAALITLAVSLAAACFTATGGEEPEHTPVEPPATPTVTSTAVPTAEASPEPSVTPESLLAELRSHGMEFEHHVYGQFLPFARMNGFVGRDSVTGTFRWGEETLWVYEFTGPGEALVAATRVRADGSGYMMPTRNHSQWVGGGGYGVSRPLRYFLQGKIIAAHFGDSREVPAVLEELMGKPFAGTSLSGAQVSDEERIPGYADLWQEHVVEVEFMSAELFKESSDGLTYLIRYRANLVHSFACSGESLFEKESVGDEIRFTMVQRTVNTDLVEMSEPCDMEWKWTENSAVVQKLVAGQSYEVIINGNQVGTFTAG